MKVEFHVSKMSMQVTRGKRCVQTSRPLSTAVAMDDGRVLLMGDGDAASSNASREARARQHVCLTLTIEELRAMVEEVEKEGLWS